MSELKSMPSTSILEMDSAELGWRLPAQTTYTLTSSISDGGLQSSFQLPSAFGDVDTCQCAQVGCLCHLALPFVLQPRLWKGASGRVRELHTVRSRAEEVQLRTPGAPTCQATKSEAWRGYFFLGLPEQQIRSSEF